MSLRLPISILLIVLGACDGGVPPDIERICVAATECGAIGADDTETCMNELDSATPDSATRAASECATCLDTMTCGEVSSGGCGKACAPLRDSVNSEPGTVTGACTGSSLYNFAGKSNVGNNLVIQLDCHYIDIIPGRYSDFQVGVTKPCGQMTVVDQICPQGYGNVSIVEKDGRRWAKGSCSCSGVSVGFEVPFRIAF